MCEIYVQFSTVFIYVLKYTNIYKGGSEIFSFWILSTFFLGWPNWVSELSQSTEMSLFRQIFLFIFFSKILTIKLRFFRRALPLTISMLAPLENF